MAADNLTWATGQTKNIITSLKKKISNVRVSIESLSAEVEKMEAKVDNVVSQAEIYKSKVEREMGREVRRLERELALLRKQGVTPATAPPTSSSDLKVATTIGIFDSILRHMCADADDFRLASEAFLFPAVYERVVEGTVEDYFIDEVPKSANLVLTRGQEYIRWIREEYHTHVTDPEAWDSAIEYIAEWWRNDALPLLYGSRDEQWDIDLPLTLPEMLQWRESPIDRPLNFPRIFDAYELYRKHKDEIYGTAGLREFDLKHFSFSAN